MSQRIHDSREPDGRRVISKVCGADVELGNFVLGIERTRDSCAVASRALLREVVGVRGESSYRDGWASSGGYPVAQAASGTGSHSHDARDWGRRFLPANGGCAYIDLDHLEICLPEVRSARDHVAVWHAMLRVARKALGRANRKLPAGFKAQVLVNNSDGDGHSYGGHLDFLITRAAWDNLFHRKMHHMLFLAAYQVSSIVFTGQGKVGSENGAPPVDFQLSQRADFLETLTGPQTTFHRPIVNSRDEPLCGVGSSAADGLARLHVIFYDSNLAHVACFLKVGVLQIILAMIEAECVNSDLALDDPVDALLRFSHDPTLKARATTLAGRKLNALEMQLLFLEEAERFVASGVCAEHVPDCEEILELWRDTLATLETRELGALARRLDWALKLSVLHRVRKHRPDLDWQSPEIKHLDQIFGSLSPSEGLYWAHERSGFVERVVPEERIRWFVGNPPDDTRAWARAMLLRRAARDVDTVDWDRIRFRTGSNGYATTYRTLDMTDPTDFTRETTDAAIRESGSLDEILDMLGATREHGSAASAAGSDSWSHGGQTHGSDSKPHERKNRRQKPERVTPRRERRRSHPRPPGGPRDP